MFDVVITGGWHLVVHFVALFIVLAALMKIHVRSIEEHGESSEQAVTWKIVARVVSTVGNFLLFLILMWAFGITFIA